MAETVRHSTVLDSEQQLLGKVYAKALLGAAGKAGIIEQVLDEYQAFQADVLDALPDFEVLLNSPRVAQEVKLGLLDRSLTGRVSDTFMNFLKVLVRHRRFDCVRAALLAAIALYNEMSGCVDVLVTAASALTDEMQAGIVERIEATLGRRVNLTVRIDPELLAGMVVRVGDTMYDASLTGRLERLREAALERASQSISESFGRFEV